VRDREKEIREIDEGEKRNKAIYCGVKERKEKDIHREKDILKE